VNPDRFAQFVQLASAEYAALTLGF
jgi:hypothetical protein